MWRGYGDGYGAWGSEAELFVNGWVAKGSNDAGTMCDIVVLVGGADDDVDGECGMWRGLVAVGGIGAVETEWVAMGASYIRIRARATTGAGHRLGSST